MKQAYKKIWEMKKHLNSMREARIKDQVRKLEAALKGLMTRTWRKCFDKSETASLINYFKSNQCFTYEKGCISFIDANCFFLKKLVTWVFLNDVDLLIKGLV